MSTSAKTTGPCVELVNYTGACLSFVSSSEDVEDELPRFGVGSLPLRPTCGPIDLLVAPSVYTFLHLRTLALRFWYKDQNSLALNAGFDLGSSADPEQFGRNPVASRRRESCFLGGCNGAPRVRFELTIGKAETA